jgi:hypothetical protein
MPVGISNTVQSVHGETERRTNVRIFLYVIYGHIYITEKKIRSIRCRI